MKLYLVRHGETDWNRQKKVQGHVDIPLNSFGREMAQKTAMGLLEVSFDVAYTSPLIRARETAEIILKDRNVPLLEEEAIKEISFGLYEGVNYEEIGQDVKYGEFIHFFQNPDKYVPAEGGESIEHLKHRVGEFLERLYIDESLQDKNILISSHGAAVTAMKNVIKGWTDTADFSKVGRPKNCSVTIVEVVGGKAKILEEDKVYH